MKFNMIKDLSNRIDTVKLHKTSKFLNVSSFILKEEWSFY